MPERKAHVIRIKGREKGSDDELEDVWVDVRRVDEITIDDRGDGQVKVISLAWDDGYVDGATPDEERKTTELKLTDPENPPDDPDDPDIWIPLKVIDQATVTDSDQKIILVFNNEVMDGQDTTRKVTARRVTFAETNVDPLDDPVNAEEYERDESTKDEDQYLDVEVISEYRYDDADQVVVTEFDTENDELINSFEETPGDRPQPPVRLDPFQDVVNVQWQVPLQVVFSWQSGVNEPSDGTQPRVRFYKTVFRDSDRSGSDSGFSATPIPGFLTDVPRSSDTTTEQDEALEELFNLEPSYNGGAARMGSKVYFAGTGPSNSNLYAIDREGKVTVLADISAYTTAIPDTMVEVHEASLSLVKLVAVPGALFLTMQFSGNSPDYTIPSEDPEIPPTIAHSVLLAVSYVGFDLKGNLLIYEMITGPLITTSVPSVPVVFTEAYSPNLDTGKFED